MIFPLKFISNPQIVAKYAEVPSIKSTFAIYLFSMLLKTWKTTWKLHKTRLNFSSLNHLIGKYKKKLCFAVPLHKFLFWLLNSFPTHWQLFIFNFVNCEIKCKHFFFFDKREIWVNNWDNGLAFVKIWCWLF